MRADVGRREAAHAGRRSALRFSVIGIDAAANMIVIDTAPTTVHQ